MTENKSEGTEKEWADKLQNLIEDFNELHELNYTNKKEVERLKSQLQIAKEALKEIELCCEAFEHQRLARATLKKLEES